MQQEKKYSGVETSFKDKNGEPIRVHSYVRDDEGNMYYVNSHCQAVPDGGDAPAVELGRLMETTGLTAMSADEVLNQPRPDVKRSRGRKIKAAPLAPPEKKDPAVESDEREPLNPVYLELVLSALPDDALANELRRRGYTLCAVKPVLLNL